MRILAVRDIVAPIKSDIANAYIDFSAMTASVVAIVTDRVCDGRRVVGYGFNSNGRYAASGLLRDRFIPRLLEADPADLLQAALGTRYAGPLATGENLFSMQDARNLVRHGGMRPDRDVLQFDPVLSYGLVEYLRTLDMMRAHGW